MPFALPFIAIGVKEILIPFLITTAVTVLGWSLVSPQGRLTWGNVVKWIDHNVKQVVEYIAKAAKEGFRRLSWEYYYLARAFESFINTLEWKFYAVRNYILSYISSYVLPRILTLEQWRIDAAAWLHSYIEANLIRLIEWKNNIVAWLHYYIEANLVQLIKWRIDVAAYIHNVIEKSIDALSLGLHQVRGRLWSLEGWVKGEIDALKSFGLSFVTSLSATLGQAFALDIKGLLKEYSQRFAKAVGITAVISLVFDAIGKLTGKAAQEAIESLDYVDSLGIDELYLAWCKLTAPVLIGDFKEWTATISQSFDSIVRNS